jgi:hypothetical protein
MHYELTIRQQQVYSTSQQVFSIEQKTTVAAALWPYKWVLLGASLLYIVQGFNSVCLVGWSFSWHGLFYMLIGSTISKGGAAAAVIDDRSHWTIPMTNNRLILAAHLFASAPFLLLVLLQKSLIPWVSIKYTERAIYHRRIGIATVFFGGLAALTAMALSLSALEGTGIIFFPWSCLWFASAVLAFYYAHHKQWREHRLWANFLSQSALIFLLGRVCITTCIFVLGECGLHVLGGCGLHAENFHSIGQCGVYLLFPQHLHHTAKILFICFSPFPLISHPGMSNVRAVYYWSMIGAGSLALLRFAIDQVANQCRH